MWGRSCGTATSSGLRPQRLGPGPRPEALNLPGALFGAAGFALQPSLRALPSNVARQEVAAGQAVLAVSTGDRGDSAACAAGGIFPRSADLFAAAGEHIDDG